MDYKDGLAGLFAEALCKGAIMAGETQQNKKNEWGVLHTEYENLQDAGFTADEAMQILLCLIQCAFAERGEV